MLTYLGAILTIVLAGIGSASLYLALTKKLDAWLENTFDHLLPCKPRKRERSRHPGNDP